ncbi:MAG TPA: hypothetical protein DCW42_08185 [Bacteroidetes bacterium]|nr:hypothetical protein [Bacteroidota bacterium]
MDTPQERLKYFILSQYKKIKDFCEDLGISPYSIDKYINKGHSVLTSADYIQKLSEMGLNIEWYRTGKGEMLQEHEQSNIKQILKVKDKEGVPYFDLNITGGIVETFNDILEKPSFFIDFLPLNDCTAYFPFWGDSMMPLLNSGDVVAVKKVNNTNVLLWGEAYLIITNANSNNLRTVKLIFKHADPSKIILRAINPAFAGDIEVNKEDIIGIYLIKGKISKILI